MSLRASLYCAGIAPMLTHVDSEIGHRLAVRMLHRAEGSLMGRVMLRAMSGAGVWCADPRLAVDVAGLHFRNPLLVGAGWDKEGRAVRGLSEIGFGDRKSVV